MNNYYKYLLTPLLSVFALFVFSITSCDTTDPPKIKSPRDYTWTADTVYNPQNPQTLMNSIWGSSENDIYMCGHSSGSPGGLWHYNGNKWEVIDLKSEVDSYGLYTAVHGSSPQNIWVVGYRKHSDGTPYPFIVQFNGANWERYEIDVNTAPYSVFVSGINDVWICGSDGIVAHYDKVHLEWEVDTAYVKVNENEKYFLNSILELNGVVYSVGYKVSDTGLNKGNYFFKKENNIWKLTDSYTGSDDYKFGYKLFFVENKIYSVGQYGVYKWINNRWNVIISTEKYISQVASASFSSIILASGLGYVYYYDGANVYNISSLENEDTIYSGVWMSDDSATIIGWIVNESPQKTIVFKGK